MAIKMNKYAALDVLLLLSLLRFGSMNEYAQPVAEKIWSEPCIMHSTILNDCNWCRCKQSRYSCDARVCNEVDMFGHFNDAIREMEVGMEGHGAWRSGQTACNPGMHYHREKLLCVCTEDGGWPSPVCRDTFMILHPVEIVKDVKSFKNQQCTPANLYLIGCNVCFCPADGIPNPKFCTRKTCAKDDPVYDMPKNNNEIDEVYAQCTVNMKYKLGCQNCVCLRNNRLICDNCTDSKTESTVCSQREPGEIFNIECNTCQCDEDGLLYCTVKHCLKSQVSSKDVIDDTELKSVAAPINDIVCKPGTKYKKDCNICYCFNINGIKKFGCTLNNCSNIDYTNDCVEGSIYETNCLVCQCAVYSGKKMQICHQDSKCLKLVSRQLQQLTDLRGYCEPLHLYKKDCNTCECLPDGKTVRCTANLCQRTSVSDRDETQAISDRNQPDPDRNESSKKSIVVEIVPVMKDIGHCPKGSIFKLDCNVCFCLSNGDVICSTKYCETRE